MRKISESAREQGTKNQLTFFNSSSSSSLQTIQNGIQAEKTTSWEACSSAGKKTTTTPRPRRLTRTAFYDAPLFVTSLSVVKNFVLVGDAHKGCRFVHSINGVKNLIELSKDFDASDVSGVGFAVCGRRLSSISVDRVGAVRVSAFDASHQGSWRGKRLIPLAAVRGATSRPRWCCRRG